MYQYTQAKLSVCVTVCCVFTLITFRAFSRCFCPKYFIHWWRWRPARQEQFCVQYLGQGHFDMQSRGIKPATFRITRHWLPPWARAASNHMLFRICWTVIGSVWFTQFYFCPLHLSSLVLKVAEYIEITATLIWLVFIYKSELVISLTRDSEWWSKVTTWLFAPGPYSLLIELIRALSGRQRRSFRQVIWAKKHP